jgi:hypothetical protein
MPSNKTDYQRKYYLANKEKILTQVKSNAVLEIECDLCKKMVKKSSMAAHKQTKLHKYIEQQSNKNVEL